MLIAVCLILVLGLVLLLCYKFWFCLRVVWVLSLVWVFGRFGLLRVCLGFGCLFVGCRFELVVGLWWLTCCFVFVVVCGCGL